MWAIVFLIFSGGAGTLGGSVLGGTLRDEQPALTLSVDQKEDIKPLIREECTKILDGIRTQNAVEHEAIKTDLASIKTEIENTSVQVKRLTDHFLERGLTRPSPR
jgi:hypothetical protein